jgi:hypothetical protein
VFTFLKEANRFGVIGDVFSTADNVIDFLSGPLNLENIMSAKKAPIQ